MSTLAGLVGSGAGVVTIALAMILGMHLGHVPQFLRKWAERFLIILMYVGGSAIAVTTLGSWGDWIINRIADVFGGIGAGIPHAALIITCMFLVAAVAVAIIWVPSMSTGMVAAVLPLILGLVAGGFLHAIYIATAIPAQAFATSLNAWIGG
jgi:hypothetical protein